MSGQFKASVNHRRLAAGIEPDDFCAVPELFEHSRAPDYQMVKRFQSWGGTNYFLWSGSMMVGAHPYQLVLSCSLLLASWGVCIFYILPYFTSVGLYLLSVVLMVVSLCSMCATAFTEPGVYPRRNLQTSMLGDSFRDELTSILGDRYCITCGIQRLARARHCKYCDNCVDVFDHHCPWLGTCIGVRNYPQYFAFLSSVMCSVLLLCALSLWLLLSTLVHTIMDPNMHWPWQWHVWGHSLARLTVVVWTATLLVLVGSLWVLHVYLLISKQTTSEFLRGRRRSSRATHTNKDTTRSTTSVPVTVHDNGPPPTVNITSADLPESTTALIQPENLPEDRLPCGEAAEDEVVVVVPVDGGDDTIGRQVSAKDVSHGLAQFAQNSKGPEIRSQKLSSPRSGSGGRKRRHGRRQHSATAASTLTSACRPCLASAADRATQILSCCLQLPTLLCQKVTRARAVAPQPALPVSSVPESKLSSSWWVYVVGFLCPLSLIPSRSPSSGSRTQSTSHSAALGEQPSWWQPTRLLPLWQFVDDQHPQGEDALQQQALTEVLLVVLRREWLRRQETATSASDDDHASSA